MARELNPLQLQQLYINNGLQPNPGHGDVIAVRFTGGPWGPGDRWARVAIRLQDNTGQPLQVPGYDLEPGIINLREDILIAGPYNLIRTAFLDLEPARGPERHGPFGDGRLQPGDGLSEGFQPITDEEMQAEVGTIGAARNEIRLLREALQRLQVGGVGRPIPGAILQPQPVMGPVIPINHLRSVIGNTPPNPRDVALWLGRSTAAIEGVFPIVDQITRMRVVNALVASHPGLTLTENEAGSWNAAISALWRKAHGAAAQHELAGVLSDINKKEGIQTAFNLGMQFTDGNWSLVWGIIRTLLPGQALVTNAQSQFDLMGDDIQRAENFPRVINNLYTMLGLNIHGQSIRPRVQTQQQQPRSRNQGRSQQSQLNQPRPQNRNNQSYRPPRQQQQHSDVPEQRDPRGPLQPPRGSGGGYNFRRNPQQPQRYGQGPPGPNPYRRFGDGGNPQQQGPPLNRGPDQGPRPGGNPRGGGRGQGPRNGGGSAAAVHTVKTSENETKNGSAEAVDSGKKGGKD
uniref:Gag polyprotein n=1 Tax=Feline foamy virus TaxID=53182 RepID=A0A8F8SMM0_FFV|nr:gag protein [Feline foamy virus]